LRTLEPRYLTILRTAASQRFTLAGTITFTNWSRSASSFCLSSALIVWVALP
jgi:hypothetical protein